jgi:hypothetical protein
VNQQGKVCQKQIDMFNFFERGVSNLVLDNDEDEEEEDEDSMLDRNFSGSTKNSFVHKFGATE